MGRLADFEDIVLSYKGPFINTERAIVLVNTSSKYKVEATLVVDSDPPSIKFTLTQEHLADSVSITNTYPVCLYDAQFKIDKDFAIPGTTKAWTSVNRIVPIPNILTDFEPTNGPKRQISFGSDASVVMPIEELVTPKCRSRALGKIFLTKGVAELNAPIEVVNYFANRFMRNRDLEGLIGMAADTTLPDSISLEIKEAIFSIGKAKIADAIRSKKYPRAISITDTLFSQKFQPDIELLGNLKKIPASYLPSYSFAEKIYYPECDYSHLFYDVKTCQGRVIKIPGVKILQVIGSKGFLLSMSETIIIYCSVPDTKMLSGLIDGNIVKVLGTVTGTKSYITPFGSSNTVPAISIIAVEKLY